jgi:hypothetical protein
MQQLHIPLACVALACMIGLVAECCLWSRQHPTSLFEFQHVGGGVAVVFTVWVYLYQGPCSHQNCILVCVSWLHKVFCHHAGWVRGLHGNTHIMSCVVLYQCCHTVALQSKVMLQVVGWWWQPVLLSGSDFQCMQQCSQLSYASAF